jgi:hypothetical protein
MRGVFLANSGGCRDRTCDPQLAILILFGPEYAGDELDQPSDIIPNPAYISIKDCTLLRKLYVDKRLSIYQIAKKYDCSKLYVHKHLRRCKIPSRSAHTNRENAGTPPYGYKKYRDKLAKNKEEQKALTLILKLHEEELSLRQIRRFLELEGIKPRMGQKWHINTIRRIIKRNAPESQ